MEDLTIIVRQAQQGENLAYEQVVRRFQDMAVGYAYSILGNWQEAEDVAQDAFIHAYYGLSKLRDAQAFPGWFRRIVHTQANRRLRVHHPTLVSLDQIGVTSLCDPTDVFEQQALRDEIYILVQSLSAPQRSVILLYYINEYTQKEIASFLEIPIGTVKTRLHHARKQLRLRMSDLSHLSSHRPSQDDVFTKNVMQLFEATKANDVSRVKDLLSGNDSLAQASGMVQTAVWGSDAHALHVAVMHGRKDIVDLLLQHGADINVRDEKYHFTALIHAIDLADFMPEYASLGMVDFLLKRGAVKDVWACWWLGDRDGVKEWLDKDPSLVNQIGPGPSTLLSFCNDIKAVDFLLEYGANPLQPYERVGKWGQMTPLRDLAFRGNYGLVQHLLDHLNIGIDVFFASIMGNIQKVQSLIGKNPNLMQAHSQTDHILGEHLTSLHLAVQGGHADLVQWLIDNGADINAKAYNDYTPLHYAICFGPRALFDPLPDVEESTQGIGVYHLLTDMSQLLIDREADLTARESLEQRTPLELAMSSFDDETDRSEVIRLIKRHQQN